MKQLLFCILSFLSLQACSQIEPDDKTSKPDALWVDGEMVYLPVFVDEQPVFPGGFDEMKPWMDREMLFPTDKCVEGKCYLKIIVLSSGKIARAEVLRGIPGCPECDKEAVRLALKMPAWTPAILKGKAVACEFLIPVSFKR